MDWGFNVLSTNDCVHTGGIVPRQNSSNSRSPEWNPGCVEDDTNIEHRTWSRLTTQKVLSTLTSTWKKKRRKSAQVKRGCVAIVRFSLLIMSRTL